MRRNRNVLAHNKRVTPTQLTLLDLYYEEIVGPVQTAHDQGETRVDPGTYLDVGRDELERWVVAAATGVAISEWLPEPAASP